MIGFDSLTYAGHRENLEDLPRKENFELVVADIRNGNALETAFSRFHPIAVLNFAAESHVDRSISDPLLFVETNVLGTANLLHHSLRHWKSLSDSNREKFRYLQVSTDEVYGSLGDSGKFSESTPVDPRSPYSASKAGAVV